MLNQESGTRQPAMDGSCHRIFSQWRSLEPRSNFAPGAHLCSISIFFSPSSRSLTPNLGRSWSITRFAVWLLVLVAIDIDTDGCHVVQRAEVVPGTGLCRVRSCHATANQWRRAPRLAGTMYFVQRSKPGQKYSSISNSIKHQTIIPGVQYRNNRQHYSHFAPTLVY